MADDLGKPGADNIYSHGRLMFMTRLRSRDTELEMSQVIWAPPFLV